ncbi:MAG TPA: T9SS type A sorting domain-containing protein, partial [Flavisolibacter sp.]|nr:T9SS type A sorting domain-containing protein [Flavisolibacter sp.]
RVAPEQTDATTNKTIDVYPNPASSYFVVYNLAGEEGLRLELIDLSGKVVKRQQAANIATRVETTDIAGGLYVLRITNAKGKVMKTEKVVIQK